METMDEDKDRREQLADEIGFSGASYNPAARAWVMHGAMVALGTVARRDPEAMAAVGLNITDEMVKRADEAWARAFNESKADLIKDWRLDMARAALEAALGGEQR